MTPLTVAEARAILAADLLLTSSHGERSGAGNIFGPEELETWRRLVASATDRIAAYVGSNT